MPPSAAFAPGCRSDQQLFSAAHNTKFSLGEAILEQFMNCPDSYPVNFWMSSSLPFSALRQCKADFSELRFAYLSLLPRRFQLLHRREPAFTALVLDTSPWAALVLYVKPLRAGEDAFLTFQRLGKRQAQLRHGHWPPSERAQLGHRKLGPVKLLDLTLRMSAALRYVRAFVLRVGRAGAIDRDP